jgi:peptidoglycan hydrolase-like protein with peptidoglycan-binding domain
MLSFRASLAFLMSALVIASPAFATRTHKTTTSSHSHHRAVKQTRHKLHGQQSIDSSRVTQIQQALIREHYMTGEPNGDWDSTTTTAMQKYQSDQGWQTKLMPDSRALKKLGLGPDYSGAINASNSSFSDSQPVGNLPTEQSQGFAAASGVNR